MIEDVRYSGTERTLRIIQWVAVTVGDVVRYDVIVAPNCNSVACVIDDRVLLYGHIRRYRVAAT